MSKLSRKHDSERRRDLSLGLNKHLLRIVVNVLLLSAVCSADIQPASQPISSRAAFLRAQRASRLQQSQQAQPAAPSTAIASATTSSNNQTTVTTSPVSQLSSSTTTTSVKPKLAPKEPEAPLIRHAAPHVVASNRTTRTADIEEFNMFVTNTCERELMHVNIKTSKPFFGVIHTRNQRQKSACTVEGTGETEYNLDISHVLNPQDPNYCGVIKARRESPEDKDLLSVVIAVRVHKNIELSNDKFFLLNCTNRCRRSDCSSNVSSRLRDSAGNLNLINPDDAPEGERESVTPPSRSGSNTNSDPSKRDQKDECTIYSFPWVITLLWCLGILLLASLISHCIMCSSMVCRCVKTEVEEREPSVYEDDTDDEDNLYNKKNHPMRIDYDNRDIYKTSNNYEPYNMSDDNQTKSKSRHTPSKRKSRG